MVYGLSSILGRLLNYVILTPYLTTFFRYGNQKEHADRAFSTAALSVMISTAFLVALFIGMSGPIAVLLDYPDHPEYIVLFTLILASDAVSAIPFARLRLENRPMRFAAIRLVNIAANIILIFFFMELCPWLLKKGWNNVRWIYDPENRVLYVFLANFLASFLAFLMLLPLLFRMKWKMDLSLLRTMLWYAAPLVIAGFAGAINQVVGNPMLKYFSPGSLQDKLVQVGLFGAAAKIPILMTLFTQAFNYAAEPFFFRHAHREDAKAVYAQVAQAFTLVGSLVFAGIMLYLDLVAILIGPNYREAIGIVPILLIAYLLLGIYYSFSVWFKLTDNTHIGGYIALGGSAITLLLNLLLIPR